MFTNIFTVISLSHIPCNNSLKNYIKQFYDSLVQTTISVSMIWDKFHYGDLVVKLNGNLVNLTFNVIIYARMYL